MRVKLQCLEDLLERERLVGMLLEQCLQHLCYLFLIQSFATFFLAHSIQYLIVSVAKIQNNYELCINYYDLFVPLHTKYHF